MDAQRIPTLRLAIMAIGLLVAVSGCATYGTPDMAAAPGAVEEFPVDVFVVGPAMMGSPSDDPMVGYNALALYERLNLWGQTPASAPASAQAAQRPRNERAY